MSASQPIYAPAERRRLEIRHALRKVGINPLDRNPAREVPRPRPAFEWPQKPYDREG